MTRWLLPVAAGLALGLAALVVAFALGADAARTPAQRADALAAELRCPDCQGLSVADSPTRSAQEIRRQIDELVAGGATDDEVRQHFTARYGQWIRLAPSSWVVWVVPFVVLGVGVAALAAWIGGRRQRAVRPSGPGGVSDAERRRLREEVEALDG
jgi:cytochrome c-type biogenesis protein CcmH